MSAKATKTAAPVASKLDKAQLTKAATALLAHVQKTEGSKNLLEGGGSTIFAQIHLRVIPGRALNKPIPLKIPHSLLNPKDGVELCVIVKDPSTDFKEKLAASPVPGFTKVLGVAKLRSHYKEYKSKQELVAGYDAFFADDRVIRMMPQLLGKTFFEKKKQPIPVTLDRATWAEHLQRARDATYLYLSKGQVLSVKVGRSKMTPAQVVENCLAAVEAAVEHIPKKWKNVASIHLQATNSLALPLYKKLQLPTVMSPEEEAALHGGSEEEDSEMEEALEEMQGEELEDASDYEELLEGSSKKGGKKAAAAAAGKKGKAAAGGAGKKKAEEEMSEGDESEFDDLDDEQLDALLNGEEDEEEFFSEDEEDGEEEGGSDDDEDEDEEESEEEEAVSKKAVEKLQQKKKQQAAAPASAAKGKVAAAPAAVEKKGKAAAAAAPAPAAEKKEAAKLSGVKRRAEEEAAPAAAAAPSKKKVAASGAPAPAPAAAAPAAAAPSKKEKAPAAAAAPAKKAAKAK